ncbi:MAG: UbiX family flavin prenyltransferase [Magnetococcales bacterium]|nr:UbiX family flavin prenyltransferase [Magnetococcales bacterium]
MHTISEPPITLAMTGASGARYGLRLLERLLNAGRGVDLLLSLAGRTVMARECGLELVGEGQEVVRQLDDFFARSSPTPPNLSRLTHYAQHDWNAPMASGSRGKRAMVVCPCSMGSLAAMAHGLSDNLIERGADVAIKEGWPLILVPRETPLSIIHLENMMRLAKSGAVILPAAPGFYQGATTLEHLVDFLVDRIMTRLDV